MAQNQIFIDGAAIEIFTHYATMDCYYQNCTVQLEVISGEVQEINPGINLHPGSAL